MVLPLPLLVLFCLMPANRADPDDTSSLTSNPSGASLLAVERWVFVLLDSCKQGRPRWYIITYINSSEVALLAVETRFLGGAYKPFWVWDLFQSQALFQSLFEQSIQDLAFTVDSRYLEFCEARSVFFNQKYILIAVTNQNLVLETILQVQITRSAN